MTEKQIRHHERMTIVRMLDRMTAPIKGAAGEAWLDTIEEASCAILERDRKNGPSKK